jgi:hypothetical protein
MASGQGGSRVWPRFNFRVVRHSAPTWLANEYDLVGGSLGVSEFVYGPLRFFFYRPALKSSALVRLVRCVMQARI